MHNPDPHASEDAEQNYSAWRFHSRSRYRQFAQQTLHPELSNWADGYENKSRMGPLRRSVRNVRHVSGFAARSFLQSQDGKLCGRCSQIDFKDMVQRVHLWYDSAYILGDLTQVVRDADCSFCGLLKCLLDEYREDGRTDNTCFYLAAFPTSALHANEWTWQNPPAGVTQTVSFSIFDEVSFHDESSVRRAHLIRAIGCISPFVKKGNVSSFQAREVENGLNAAAVRSWLNYCSHHHLSTCTSAEGQLDPSTKVIDCHSRAVVDLDPEGTYLALSYVWGKRKGRESVGGVIANSATYQSFPQTVEDAITLTEQLGYAYLWVDRYCIPQEDVPERRIQIAQMDRIYAGAEATIIAAAGEDPHYGLPGISKRRSSQLNHVNLDGESYTVVPPDPLRAIQNSRWNRRAWTYQESMLSKRRIIFCDQQVYFECSAMHCYEAMQAPLHLLHSSLCSRFSEWNEPGLFPVEQQRHALDHLFHHLALYTVRELSFSGDILNGMLGIFAAFTHQPIAAKSNRNNRRIMQIAGIPIVPNNTLITYDPIDPPVYHLSREGQFITGLGWKLASPAERRPGFPSWSWAGWYGAVLPRTKFEGYIRNTHKVELSFTVQRSPAVAPSSVDIKTILNAYQRKNLTPDYIPSLTITGWTVAINIRSTHPSLRVRSDPPGFVAFLDTEEGFYAADRFFLTYADPRLSRDHPDTFDEHCIGLVLGMAQCTYLAGGDGRTKVLDDSTFPLMILVLWERDGKWERIGLVEHTIRVRTDENPEPIGTLYLPPLNTCRRSLRLG